MGITTVNNYNNSYTLSKKEVTKKEETNQTTSKSNSTEDYLSTLEKLAPSVQFRVGTSFSTAKSGKTLTIHPKILEKMQNNPEQEKETKELIKGVESMTRLVDGIKKATGGTVVYRHSYIDENGKYRSISFTKKDDKLSAKIRENTKKNTEKLMEKSKQNAAKRKAELQKTLEKKKTEKGNQKLDNKIEKMISEKMAASKDGVVYCNDKEMKNFMEIMRQQNNSTIGARVNLQV